MGLGRVSMKNIPGGVWVLGGVSLLMDMSSEMIHSLLPLFLVGTLGATSFEVGLIEGLAEAAALVAKVFSGSISDYLGRRKGLALLGYSLSACAKPLFPLASTSSLVLLARFSDRLGKGIRGAPRDALIADLTPAGQRGAAFGLRQSLDTLGAFLGPLIAYGLLTSGSQNIKDVFWWATLPAVMAALLLWVGLEEPPAHSAEGAQNPLSAEAIRRLRGPFLKVVLIGSLLSMARFSEAFLVLKAEQVQISLASIPLVMVAMNAIFSMSAYPFGALADRVRRENLLLLGILILGLSELTLALAHSWLSTLGGIALWGLHLGITQGLLSKWVAESAPLSLRGTAFGLFNLASGATLLLGNLLAGLLWDHLGSSAPFWGGTVICTVLLLLLLHRSNLLKGGMT